MKSQTFFKGIVVSLMFCVLAVQKNVLAVQKPLFGGNLKVAEDLSRNIASGKSREIPRQLSVSETEGTLTIDFSLLPQDRQTEIETYYENLKDPSNECHWILDYPFFHHESHSVLEYGNGKMVFKPEEPDILPVLRLSECLYPDAPFIRPFRQTQYGFEANQTCISGRPFVDSISPIYVDPLNPYLSFKLNDVDVFLIPEERFQQVSSDPDLAVIPGIEYFIFLKTAGLKPDVLHTLKSVIEINELMKSALNNHAKPLLEQDAAASDAAASNAAASEHKSGLTVSLTVPEESPFHLVGERLRLQLLEAGFQMAGTATPDVSLELVANAAHDPDMDLARYRILKDHFPHKGSETWFELWDNLESTGRLIPLVLYESKIAVRKNIFNLKQQSGALDFSNTWIQRLQ